MRIQTVSSKLAGKITFEFQMTTTNG